MLFGQEESSLEAVYYNILDKSHISVLVHNWTRAAMTIFKVLIVVYRPE